MLLECYSDHQHAVYHNSLQAVQTEDTSSTQIDLIDHQSGVVFHPDSRVPSPTEYAWTPVFHIVWLHYGHLVNKSVGYGWMSVGQTTSQAIKEHTITSKVAIGTAKNNHTTRVSRWIIKITEGATDQMILHGHMKILVLADMSAWADSILFFSEYHMLYTDQLSSA